MPNPLIRTGRPKGGPPGPHTLKNRPLWIREEKKYQLLLHWLSLNHPRRLILQYCDDVGIKVPGTLLGIRLQGITNFAKAHIDEINHARENMRVSALVDAQDKREKFLEQQYRVRDLLYENMMTDRDASNRTHMIRDYIHLTNAIADLEGFKKGTFDPRQQKALEALADAMFGEKDAAAPVDAEVTVLSPAELPPGKPGSPEGASV